MWEENKSTKTHTIQNWTRWSFLLTKNQNLKPTGRNNSRLNWRSLERWSNDEEEVWNSSDGEESNEKFRELSEEELGKDSRIFFFFFLFPWKTEKNGKIRSRTREIDDESLRTACYCLSLSLSRRKVAKSPSRPSASGHEPLDFLSLSSLRHDRAHGLKPKSVFFRALINGLGPFFHIDIPSASPDSWAELSPELSSFGPIICMSAAEAHIYLFGPC